MTFRKNAKYTVFSVPKNKETTVFYACNYSEPLGPGVYKGYPCSLKSEPIDFTHRVEKNDLHINEEKPVAIKLYDGKHHPSSYQFYASEIAQLNIEHRDVLIMDFIDGVHIYPEAHNNALLRTLSFFQAVDIAWQLILGLNHLHYRNTSGIPIVHGDIKGENIKIRFRVIDVNDEKKYKVDVFYLDLDYAKPITDIAQIPQGTEEHLALEVCEGYYSESSDFFALCPLLLSIFGANNPFKEISDFKNKNSKMQPIDLIKKFRDIDFCTAGIFTNFEKKPPSFLCLLIKDFILKMGKKEKKNRPTPDAILEFFTALRQLSLIDEYEDNMYLVRLYMAAQNEDWLTKDNYKRLFFNAEENLKNRLTALLSKEQFLSLMNTDHQTQSF